ncbi:MAG: S49 family peptidase [Caulobacterales bacterium]|nr:S49 family peptidase [Caulobacterales bacterium]
MSKSDESRPIGGSVRIAADRVIVREGGFFTELLRMSAKIIVGGLLIIAMLGLASFSFDEGAGEFEKAVLSGTPSSDNEILLVRVDGPILNHPPRGGGLFGFAEGLVFGYEVKNILLDAADDDAVKAVLLFLSTPGGQIAGSQAIHEGVLAVRDAGKPVIAHIDGLSASGGVWAMAAADEIFADHGSVVGSVGVLGPSLVEYIDPVALGGVLDGVETRGGVKRHSVTAGRGKDLGDPFRPPTAEETRRLQEMVDEFYEQFLGHMELSRGMSRALLTDELGASLFANELAEIHGYIDGTKTYDESITHTADAAGLGDDYKLVSADQEVIGFPFFGIQSRLQGGARAGAEAARIELIAAACAAFRSEPLVMPTLYRAQLCGR